MIKTILNKNVLLGYRLLSEAEILNSTAASVKAGVKVGAKPAGASN